MNKRTKQCEHIVVFFFSGVDLVSLWDFGIAAFHASLNIFNGWEFK